MRNVGVQVCGVLFVGIAACTGDSGARSEPDTSRPSSDAAPSTPIDAGDGNAATGLHFVNPGAQSVDEEKELRLTLSTTGGGAARIFLEGLPPGASWDEGARTFSFTPDFLQGGQTWHVALTADDGVSRVHDSFDVRANDTIVPRAPVVTSSQVQSGFTRLTVTQTTDAFLDSPGFAGRTFTAIVTVPTDESGTTPVPVRVGLHGFGGAPQTDGSSGEYRIFPADPNDTYWWGYASSLPGGAATSGAAPSYTARRVLHLLSWLLKNHPHADPERVYLDGSSMGGAGAMTIGALSARHFCHVRASFGQAIPKNHRPSRLAQLAPLWGTPSLPLDDGHGASIWDRMDMTRALAELPEARDQFFTLKHSKDDATIHFGAAVMPSALTGTTLYGALQSLHIGHHAAWDEGGHGIADPVLGNGWWTSGWDPVFDATASLRRDRAFPAFSGSSIDRQPGTGKSNGKRPWNAESGYAGNVATPGDTGWDGEIAGALNRFLRWDATKLVDTIDRFELPLRVVDGTGGAPPKVGYPTTGDKLDGTSPVIVDVTPRRTQAFRCRAGEHVAWELGTQRGTATADARGAVTVPRASLTTAWTTLILTRTP